MVIVIVREQHHIQHWQVVHAGIVRHLKRINAHIRHQRSVVEHWVGNHHLIIQLKQHGRMPKPRHTTFFQCSLIGLHTRQRLAWILARLRGNQLQQPAAHARFFIRSQQGSRLQIFKLIGGLIKRFRGVNAFQTRRIGLTAKRRMEMKKAHTTAARIANNGTSHLNRISRNFIILMCRLVKSSPILTACRRYLNVKSHED